ncbi:MAG: hypothetical protein V4760_01715 [Bdellovibrionota bacterium]
MIRNSIILSVVFVGGVFAASVSMAADNAKPKTNAPSAAAAKKPAELETISMIIKDLLPNDNGVVIKPEGGGKALTLHNASNNKTFTAAKMQKLQDAMVEKTPIKFLVNGVEVVDILD